MAPAASRIILIDEHRTFADLLTTRIDAEPDLSVVGRTAILDDAAELFQKTQPDISIFDVEMRGCDVFAFIGAVRSQWPHTKILLLSAISTGIMISEAMRLDVRGYITKREPLEIVIDCLRKVANGETCFSSEIKKRLRFDPAQKRYTAQATGHLQALTPRQLEVLRHLARGDSVKEVARKMYLSHKSIDSHKYRIMQLLGVHDRVHLARFAIREGLILP